MVQGSRSSSCSDWEADERQDLWKMNSQPAFDSGLCGDLEHGCLKKIPSVPSNPLWGFNPCNSETSVASARKGACPRLQVSSTCIWIFWLPGLCHPPFISPCSRDLEHKGVLPKVGSPSSPSLVVYPPLPFSYISGPPLISFFNGVIPFVTEVKFH